MLKQSKAKTFCRSWSVAVNIVDVIYFSATYFPNKQIPLTNSRIPYIAPIWHINV